MIPKERKIESLLENRLLILVFTNFQHKFVTNLETIVVKVSFSTSIIKIDVEIHYTKLVFPKNQCDIVRNIQKKCKNNIGFVKTDVVIYDTTSVVSKLMLNSTYNISFSQIDVVWCITKSILVEPMLFRYYTTSVLVKTDVVWCITT